MFRREAHTKYPGFATATKLQEPPLAAYSAPNDHAIRPDASERFVPRAGTAGSCSERESQKVYRDSQFIAAAAFRSHGKRLERPAAKGSLFHRLCLRGQSRSESVHY